MKQKLINLGYALVISGLVLGGVHNILSSHPIWSQSYNKLWQAKDQTAPNLESQTESETIEINLLPEENLSSSTPEPAQTETKPQVHTHTWTKDNEFIWVGNGDGTGHVEEKKIARCECGATQE